MLTRGLGIEDIKQNYLILLNVDANTLTYSFSSQCPDVNGENIDIQISHLELHALLPSSR